MTEYARYTIEITDPRNAIGKIENREIRDSESGLYRSFNPAEKGTFDQRRQELRWPKQKDMSRRRFGGLDFHIQAEETTELVFKLRQGSKWNFKEPGFDVIPLKESSKNFDENDIDVRDGYKKDPTFSTPIIKENGKECTLKFTAGVKNDADHYLYVLHLTDPKEVPFLLDPIIKDGDSVPDLRNAGNS